MKLITQNIYCITSWESKKDILLKNFKEQNPDILCIQELLSGKENPSQEVNDISNDLDARAIFIDPYDNMSNQGIFINNEDFKIKEQYAFNLSGIYEDGNLDSHRRFVTAVVLDINGEELVVINLHLSVIKAFRHQNWKEIMKWLRGTGLIEKNIILVGDMNSYEDNDVHLDILKDGFKDSWKEVNRDTCITYYSSQWWSENYPNHPVGQKVISKKKEWPNNCIDYIFYKGDIKINSVNYLNLVPEGADHIGLILDFGI